MNLELMAYLTDPHRLWAIDQPYLYNYERMITAHGGGKIEARMPESSMVRAGNVAVIDVNGPISPRPSIFSAIFGGASISTLQADFRQAMADDTVTAILFAFSTPGGEVSGVSEFAAEIAAARGKGKPIVAHVGQMAASAGYWLASGADKIVSSREGMSGAIGVVTCHADISGQLEQDGIKVTVISAGKFKAEGAPSLPLSPEAEAHKQSMVDTVYGYFTNEVGEYRGVSGSAVRAGYGQGRVLLGQAAKEAGLVDSLGTFNGTLARLSGRTRSSMMRAGSVSLAEALEQSDEELAAGSQAAAITAQAAADLDRAILEGNERARHFRLL